MHVADDIFTLDAIRDHYDRLSVFYRASQGARVNGSLAHFARELE